MYRRTVDYCSGAFLLTKSALFREIGGFDERYVPAYYEETDYCMALQRRGLEIVYEPRALISHFEFGSAALSARAFELMGTNRLKFLDKHRAHLATKHAPGTSSLVARSPKRRRVLYIEDYVPHKYYGAGFPRANDIVTALDAAGYEVTIFPTSLNNLEAWSTAYQDLPPTVEIMLGLGEEGLPRFLLERAEHYDLYWVCRPHNMRFIVNACGRFLQQNRAPIVYDAEAIFSARLRLEQAVLGGHEESKIATLERQEFDLAKTASASSRSATTKRESGAKRPRLTSMS